MNTQEITTGPLKVKSATLILGLALVAGLAFDWLVRHDPPGLGFVLFSSLVVVSAVVVRRPRRKETYLLLAASWSLACWTMIRAADFLVAIDICAAILLLSAAASSEVYTDRIWLLRIRSHISSWFSQLGALCVGAVRPVAALIHERTNLQIGRAAPFLRGVLFATPVFALFAVLLASADAVFSNFLGDVIPDWDITIGSTAAHVIWIAAIGWIAAGFYVWTAQPEKQPGPEARGSLRIGYVETMSVLGSVAALFGLFVIFQIEYLFGGVAELPGVTYAEYARSGFFQLLAVATLTAGLIWLALEVSGDQLEGRRLTAFRAVCIAMILLTGVILLSALKRLGLYEQVFGFTRLRLLSHLFTFLVAGALALLAVQLFQRSRPLFLAGTVALGFCVLTVLNSINPDAYIAARNIDRAQNGKLASLGYIDELSADAVPTVIDRYRRSAIYPRLGVEIDQWSCLATATERSWRGWNLGHSRAVAARQDAGLDKTRPRWMQWQQICDT
ncbi:MAG: DUF4153 domain-containing protein [Solirubrobacterales bacterium]